MVQSFPFQQQRRNFKVLSKSLILLFGYFEVIYSFSFWQNNIPPSLSTCCESIPSSIARGRRLHHIRPSSHKDEAKKNGILCFSTPNHHDSNTLRHSKSPHCENESNSNIMDEEYLKMNWDDNRRSFVINGATWGLSVIAASTGLVTIPENSFATDIDAGSPICVVGASGRTGMECVKACLERSMPVKATSRSGVFTDGSVVNNEELLTAAVCDVTQPNTILPAIDGSRAVIFAASASKQGGTPAMVDNAGLVNVAKACIEAKIPHLVILSSGSVTKPNSPVYKFLNLFGNIMEEKIKGEDTVRAMYDNNSNKSSLGLTYTVIRPGGLTEEESLGVERLELNQGDTKSGRIARADVAALCVESTIYPQLTGGTTFECYNADTGKPLSSVGISNILKSTNKENDTSLYVSGKERRGSTWEALFTGLEKDN